MQRFIDEVENRLAAMARGIPPAHAEFKRRYHGSEHPHLGLTVPRQALFIFGGMVNAFAFVVFTLTVVIHQLIIAQGR